MDFDIFQISCCSSNDFDHPDTSPPRGLPQNKRQPLLQNPPHHFRRKRRDRQPHQILHSTETAKEEAQSHVSSLQHSQLDIQSTLGFATMDKAANLALTTAFPLTDLRQ